MSVLDDTELFKMKEELDKLARSQESQNSTPDKTDRFSN